MDINNIIHDNLMQYSTYILLNRCLPDIRDGLKPIHRKILYSMYLDKVTDFTKSANVTGAVMRFSPHGDCYDTVVNLTQKDKQTHPLITGKGNFSQHTSKELQPAASRYTEIKLSEVALEMLNNLDKNMVDFVDNYDGTRKMPEVLPAKYPSILTYANSGIGVGMSSSIPSFNLKEVNDAVIHYLQTGEIKVLYPDFATGGTLVDNGVDVNLINTTGKGSICLRAKCKIEKNMIMVTEIPYSTTRETIIDKIIAQVKVGKIKQITQVKDLTGVTGMCIEITCKKNANMTEVLELLYKNTPLQNNVSVEMRMLVDGLPKVMSVQNVIEKWIEFRRQCVVRGLQYEIDKLKRIQHIQQGLIKVVVNIDEVIETIRSSEENMIIQNLMSLYKLTELQANYIAEMKLRNLNKTYIDKQTKDLEKINKQIVSYEKSVGNNKSIDKMIITTLEQINKKYAKNRMTLITKGE